MVAGFLAVAVTAIAAAWLLRAPAPPVEASLPVARSSGTVPAPATAPASTTSSTAGAVVAQAAGAVVGPGVYRLPAGSRVADLIAAAGGVAADADPGAVLLAAPVRDGDRVYVPRVGEAVPAPVTAADSGGSGPPGATATAGPVNLNAASADELDALPGVGPATAQAIVAHREAQGAFTSVDALLDVRGIGPAKLEALRPLVTV